jgi:hypothetical protein
VSVSASRAVGAGPPTDDAKAGSRTPRAFASTGLEPPPGLSDVPRTIFDNSSGSETRPRLSGAVGSVGSPFVPSPRKGCLLWSFVYLVARNLFALVWLLGRPRHSKELAILRRQHLEPIVRELVANAIAMQSQAKGRRRRHFPVPEQAQGRIAATLDLERLNRAEYEPRRRPRERSPPREASG